MAETSNYKIDLFARYIGINPEDSPRLKQANSLVLEEIEERARRLSCTHCRAAKWRIDEGGGIRLCDECDALYSAIVGRFRDGGAVSI